MVQKVVALALVACTATALLLCLLAWFPVVLLCVGVVGFFLLSLSDYSDLRARMKAALSR